MITVITKAHKPVILAHRLGTFLGIQGLRSGPGNRGPLAGQIQDHLQLITVSFYSACSCFVVWSGVHDRSSVSANLASPVDSQ